MCTGLPQGAVHAIRSPLWKQGRPQVTSRRKGKIDVLWNGTHSHTLDTQITTLYQHLCCRQAMNILEVLSLLQKHLIPYQPIQPLCNHIDHFTPAQSLYIKSQQPFHTKPTFRQHPMNISPLSSSSGIGIFFCFVVRICQIYTLY